MRVVVAVVVFLAVLVALHPPDDRCDVGAFVNPVAAVVADRADAC